MDIKEIEELELTKEENLPKQIFKKSNKAKDKLHIVYLMVWTQTCGGSKIVLEYANRLSRRGHQITIITYDKKPDWFLLDDKIKFIQVEEEKELEECIPACDLVVATSWKNISVALKANQAPAVFFEQGGSHIFDVENLSPVKKQILKQRMSEIDFIYTVSSYTREVIKREYQKDAFVVLNAVDDHIFYPRENMDRKKDNITITTIGPENSEFKRVPNVIEAISKLREKYSNIDFKWISQTEPKMQTEKAIVNPPQREIGNILRETDIYVCASDYESFGLPVLEAMTCGSAIITTDNGGISDFVEDKVNGLIIGKNSIEDIINSIQFLIENPEERVRLAHNGMNKAKELNWQHSVERVEKYYQEIAQYEISKIKTEEEVER